MFQSRHKEVGIRKRFKKCLTSIYETNMSHDTLIQIENENYFYIGHIKKGVMITPFFNDFKLDYIDYSSCATRSITAF